MNTLSPEYVAGFIDGEGYIGIIRRTSQKTSRGFYYKAVIKVAQRNDYRDALDRLKDQYNGYISKTRQHINTRDSVMWEISNKQHIAKLLTEIQPYAIVKSKHVELVLQFVQLPQILNSLSLEEKNEIYSQQEAIFKSLAIINKRGLAETE